MPAETRDVISGNSGDLRVHSGPRSEPAVHGARRAGGMRRGEEKGAAEQPRSGRGGRAARGRRPRRDLEAPVRRGGRDYGAASGGLVRLARTVGARADVDAAERPVLHGLSAGVR